MTTSAYREDRESQPGLFVEICQNSLCAGVCQPQYAARRNSPAVCAAEVRKSNFERTRKMFRAPRGNVRRAPEGHCGLRDPSDRTLDGIHDLASRFFPYPEAD